MTNPAQDLFDLTNQVIVSRSLHVIAEAGIADAIDVEEAVDAGTIADRTGCHEDAIHRMLRLLETSGVFAFADGKWRHTETSQLIRSDHPQSMRAYARMVGSPVCWSSMTSMKHSLTTGQAAAALLDPRGSWGYLAAHPDEAAVFNDSMVSKAHADAAALTAAYDFTRGDIVLDIGGGRGQILDAILEAAPSARGVLFDLPSVAEEAIVRPDGRLKVQSGDFFVDSLPSYDVGVLVHVLHDWADPEVAAILRATRAAAQPGSTLLVYEMLMSDDDADVHSPDSWRPKVLDVLMLTITGGRERTRAEFVVLLAAAGFALTRVIPLPTGSSIVEAKAVSTH